MFGLGHTELIVILVLGLLVLGPERIPGVASSLGKAIRSFRRATRDLRDQIDLEDDVRRPFEDLRAALKSATGGRGVDLVFDPVGGELAETALRACAENARYLVIGFAQGGIPALPWNLPLLKGASIVGVFWGSFVRHEPAASARGLAELAQWYAAGKIKPAIEQRLPMRELPAAFARMASRQVQGKLLLVNA